jgi:hypothetical protein
LQYFPTLSSKSRRKGERDIETNDFFAGSAFFRVINSGHQCFFYTITKGDVMVRRFCGQMFFVTLFREGWFADLMEFTLQLQNSIFVFVRLLVDVVVLQNIKQVKMLISFF